MIKFKVSEIARDDITNIMLYLALNNAQSAADRLRSKLNSEFENLKLFPLSGTKIKSKRFRRYRFYVVERYYIFYTYENDTVAIERVLHTARDYKDILDTELSI